MLGPRLIWPYGDCLTIGAAFSSLVLPQDGLQRIGPPPAADLAGLRKAQSEGAVLDWPFLAEPAWVGASTMTAGSLKRLCPVLYAD